MTGHYQGLSGNGWRVSAWNDSGTDQILTAYAICLTDIANVTVSEVTNDKALYAGALGQSNVRCPDGSMVSGLGYAYDPKVMMFYGIDLMGNTLRVLGKNISDSFQTLRAQAACLTPSTHATSVVASTNSYLSGGTSKSVEAVCPPGTFVSGGGFADNIELVVTNLSKKPGANAWIATANNPTRSTLALISYAVCMKITMM